MTRNVAALPITVGVGAFLARDRELLVVRKTYGPWRGLWTIPSGYVEPRESVVETIRREVREETEVVREPTALLAVRNRVSQRANDTFLVFALSYEAGEPHPDGVEVSEAEFVPLAELEASGDAAPFTRAIIPKLEKAKGLSLDAYAPPKDQMDSLAYLLYL